MKSQTEGWMEVMKRFGEERTEKGKMVNFVHIGDLHLSNRYPYGKNKMKNCISDRLIDIMRNLYKI